MGQSLFRMQVDINCSLKSAYMDPKNGPVQLLVEKSPKLRIYASKNEYMDPYNRSLQSR
jgi:hypothetical protein